MCSAAISMLSKRPMYSPVLVCAGVEIVLELRFADEVPDRLAVLAMLDQRVVDADEGRALRERRSRRSAAARRKVPLPRGMYTAGASSANGNSSNVALVSFSVVGRNSTAISTSTVPRRIFLRRYNVTSAAIPTIIRMLRALDVEAVPFTGSPVPIMLREFDETLIDRERRLEHQNAEQDLELRR